MSQNPNQQNQNQLDSKTIAEFVSNQKKQLDIEAAKLKLREKEMEVNARLATESMKLNSDLLNKSPREHRKNMLTYAGIVATLIVIMLVFIGFCLYNDREEFVLKFLQLIAYVVVTAIGYFAGVQRGKRIADKEKRNDIEEAEIVS